MTYEYQKECESVKEMEWMGIEWPFQIYEYTNDTGLIC